MVRSITYCALEIDQKVYDVPDARANRVRLADIDRIIEAARRVRRGQF